jgi:hypothetical protein
VAVVAVLSNHICGVHCVVMRESSMVVLLCICADRVDAGDAPHSRLHLAVVEIMMLHMLSVTCGFAVAICKLFFCKLYHIRYDF